MNDRHLSVAIVVFSVTLLMCLCLIYAVLYPATDAQLALLRWPCIISSLVLLAAYVIWFLAWSKAKPVERSVSSGNWADLPERYEKSIGHLRKVVEEFQRVMTRSQPVLTDEELRITHSYKTYRDYYNAETMLNSAAMFLEKEAKEHGLDMIAKCVRVMNVHSSVE
jgi:hypothetical protein